MITKSIFNYVNKNEYQVLIEKYESQLKLLKGQAVSSVMLSCENYIDENIQKAYIQGDLFTEIAIGDIEFVKLYDKSYVLFVKIGAMREEFEHRFFYIVENASISIINKLKKII